MIELSGIPASPGVAVARAFLFAPEDSSAVPARAVAAAEIDAELGRFLAAVAKSKVEVSSLRDKARIEAGDEQAAIFESHLLMLTIPISTSGSRPPSRRR